MNLLIRNGWTCEYIDVHSNLTHFDTLCAIKNSYGILFLAMTKTLTNLYTNFVEFLIF